MCGDSERESLRRRPRPLVRWCCMSQPRGLGGTVKEMAGKAGGGEVCVCKGAVGSGLGVRRDGWFTLTLPVFLRDLLVHRRRGVHGGQGHASGKQR